MEKEQLIKVMAEELDWYANEYAKYKDVEQVLAEELELEFKHRASAYNCLLLTLFIEDINYPTFRRNVTKYSTDRKDGRYEDWGF